MSQKKAIFNNGQTGSLPVVQVVRDTAKQNIVDGGEYAINTPSYGHVSRRCKFNEWVVQNAGSHTWYLPITGYDMDGITTLALAFQSGNQVISIWRGGEIDTYAANGGTPVHEFSCLRISDNSVTVDGTGSQDLFDIMHGASVGAGDTLDPNQSSQAHRPQCGVLLPGCFLIMCGKQVDQGSDVWDTEGISLVAIQSDGAGGFTRHWLGDHVGDTVPFASGRLRGREWAMTTYFPFTHMQNPCLRAFIPYVDYIYNSPASIGGQLGIIEATRANIDSVWVFGGLYHIYEKIETQVHFHSAAWTPRGVVLAQGDGALLNENPLFTCDDWDNYEDDDEWTKLEKNYGSGEYAGPPEHNYSNQWAGSSPSRLDHNAFFCGSDVDPQGLWKCEVSAALTQRYVGQWGYTHGDDLNDHLALEFSGPSKEIQPGMCCAIRNQLSSTTLRGKVVYGTEEEGFCAIARMPAGIGTSGLCKIYADQVYAFNRGGPGPSLYRIPQPRIEEIRGLAVGPGGLNRLTIVSGSPDAYDTVTPLSSSPATTVTIIQGDVGAPGQTPVYELQQAGSQSNNQIWRHYIGDAASAYLGTCTHVVFWVRSMNPKLSVPLRMIMYNQGAGANVLAFNIGGYYIGVLSTDWTMMVFSMEEGVTPPVNPNDAVLRWEASSTVVMPFHFQYQLQGVYSAAHSQCPYLVAPDTTGANEEVTQLLAPVSANWTVGIELHIPMCGEDRDYAHQSIKQSVILATIYADATNFIEITADIANEEVDFLVTVAGTPLTLKSLAAFSLCRDTTIQIGVAFDGTDYHFFGVCGGCNELGYLTDTVTGDIGEPVSVLIGDNDFSNVPNTELNMVCLDDSKALSAAQFFDMMALASESGSAGGALHLLYT